ncbi:protein SCO1 homolog, mitochondrial [Tetranychus urticae]|uniref:Thioredoxin domain-containing protein n=1 Tax=Tetranychus urticae TaxID=32264 RepID=T1L4U8_TETUR|nr:protein SCO1 homolog, mitochondrial [Tetranychus urticae]
MNNIPRSFLRLFKSYRFSNSSNVNVRTFVNLRNITKGMTKKSVAISTGILASYGLTYLYLRNEKELKKKKERSEMVKKTIGGAFDLIDHHGKPFGSNEIMGRWSLMYFGFTHCPDICPDELDKISEVVDKLSKRDDIPEVVPLFVTVDPSRDDPPAIAKYLADFSPKFIGLTGTKEAVKKVCDLFRVYSHAGIPDDNNEYIVDHTIVTYLLNPEGEFVDYYMRSNESDAIVNAVIHHMKDYETLHKKKFWLIS